MTRALQLAQIADIAMMRRRQIARKLNAAAKLERQRDVMAKSGRESHAHAKENAETYVAREFANIDPGQSASVFFASLAFGRKQAMREAVAMATRADRLAARHQEAVRARASVAGELLRAEQMLEQKTELADEAMADAKSVADAFDEEEALDVFRGGAGA